MNRLWIRQAALYAILDKELNDRRTVHCRCRVPYLQRAEPTAGDPANWKVGPLEPCANGCHVIVREAAASLAHRYSVLDELP